MSPDDKAIHPEAVHEGVKLAILASLPRVARILDYGSGSGMMTVFLLRLGYAVTATDVDPACESAVLAQCDGDMKSRFRFLRVDPLADPIEPDTLGDLRLDLVRWAGTIGRIAEKKRHSTRTLRVLECIRSVAGRTCTVRSS